VSSAVRVRASRGGRLEQIGELVRPTARTIRWSPLLGAIVVAFIQVFVQTRETCPPTNACVGPEARVLALRIAAIFLALGTAFVLDDPTEETTGHLPTPRWLRRAVRVGLVAPVVALTWALLLPLAMRSSVDTNPFPTAAVTLELATLVIAALALSVASARFVPEGMGGIAAGPILLGLIAAAHYLPERLAVFLLDPQTPRWHSAHDVWRVLLLIAVAALALVSRDPWRRPLRSFGGSVRPRPHPP
jgi:fluoroquinolone transport system permease protein